MPLTVRDASLGTSCKDPARDWLKTGPLPHTPCLPSSSPCMARLDDSLPPGSSRKIPPSSREDADDLFVLFDKLLLHICSIQSKSLLFFLFFLGTCKTSDTSGFVVSLYKDHSQVHNTHLSEGISPCLTQMPLYLISSLCFSIHT